MGKVVVEVIDGVVKQVLTDTAGIQVLVLDRDVSGVSREYVLPEVLGAQAAGDAMEQGLAKLQPVEVERTFDEVFECLEAPGVEGESVDALRRALRNIGMRTSLVFVPGTPERVQGIFRDAGYSDIKVCPGPGELPGGCDIYYAGYGESERCIAKLEETSSGWAAKVYGKEFDGNEEGGHWQQLEVPTYMSAFIVAAYVCEFFEDRASGEYSL